MLLSVSFVLLCAWSAVTPVFESPDEVHHWQYARYLRDVWHLPLYTPAFVEANSPPLYYALVAPVAVDSAAPPSLVWVDARGTLVLPFPPRLYHNAGGDFRRYWPIRLGRLLSVLMSVATVWFCWEAARRAGSRITAALCASFVAFLPEFTFRGSTISNDVLVTTMSAATMFCIVRLIGEPYSWRIGVAAALALSSAYLTKISAIGLVPAVGLALWWTGGSVRERLTRLATVLGLAGLIVLPWSARNVLLYGDPFASGAMAEAVGHIVSRHSLFDSYFLTTFPAVLSRSFVGVFGWMNVMLPEGFYWFYWALGAGGLVCLGLQLAARRRSARLPIALAVVVLANLAIVIHINRSFEQPQGRYMFVALPALALLTAMGLDRLPRRASNTLAAGLALLNVLILVRYQAAAYYPPVSTTLPNTTMALHQSYVVDLVQQDDGSARISGGDPQIGFHTQFDAASAGFLAFELAGNCKELDLQGSVYFAAAGRPASEAQQVAFSWRADGTKRLVRVALLANPLWKGTVSIVRIDPINASVARHLGEDVRIENVRVAGNLSLVQ